MKVSLKNVGMLDEAEFEVGDLTIICGENNTGKTYATYSLYGYLDFMRTIRESLFYRYRGTMLEENDEYRQEIKEKKWTYIELKEKLEKYIKNKTNLYVKDKLVEVMAGKEEDFKNSVFELKFDISIEKIKIAIKYYLETEQFVTREKRMFEHILYDDGLVIKLKDVNRTREVMYNYTLIVLDSLLAIILPQKFILSVERTGASIFQQELDFNKITQMEVIKKIIQNKSMGLFELERTRGEREQLYPKPVRDNIEFIRDLKQISKRNSMLKQDKNDLYNVIIKTLGQLVGGKYKVTDIGVFFQPKGSKKSYGIEIASSSVRSLLMLNYYILNVAQKGDILMIDEPELNLHPSNQILMGRLIALLVNAGIKVFITTHSDYIVREISNCIILNQLKNEQIATHLKRYDYNENYRLDYKKVKAYIAKYDKKSKKNTLDKVEITQANGIAMETFNEVIDETLEIDKKITNMLLEIDK